MKLVVLMFMILLAACSSKDPVVVPCAPKVVLEAGIGKGAGQFTIQSSPSRMKVEYRVRHYKSAGLDTGGLVGEGPMDFAIASNGEILILDSFGAKIEKYDKTGKHQWSSSLTPCPWYKGPLYRPIKAGVRIRSNCWRNLGVDEKGFIYIRRQMPGRVPGSIMVLNPSGKLKQIIKDIPSEYFRGIQALRGERLWLGYKLLLDRKTHKQTRINPEDTGTTFLWDPDGNVYKTAWKEKREMFTRLDESLEPIGTFSRPRRDPKFTFLQLVNPNTHVYVKEVYMDNRFTPQLDLKSMTKSMEAMLDLRKRNKLVSFQISTCLWGYGGTQPGSGTYVKVDREGHVYSMIYNPEDFPGEHGLKILKYSCVKPDHEND